MDNSESSRVRTLDTEWVWSERERPTALTTTDGEVWTSIDFSWNICFGVVRVLEANIQGCGYEISWRSRITFVLHCTKPAWFTVVTCAKFRVLCNIWSVLNFKVLNIIRISYTFKMTFSLIINWYPIYLHSCVLMNFVWSVKNFILCILRPVLEWYFANCYNIAIDIQINVVQL